MQNANRRVVLSYFILASQAALRVASWTAECELFNLRFVCCPCSQQQLRRCQTELSRQVKQSSSVIQEKVPFNDTSECLPPSPRLPNQRRAKEREASVKHRWAESLAVFIKSIGAGIESPLRSDCFSPSFLQNSSTTTASTSHHTIEGIRCVRRTDSPQAFFILDVIQGELFHSCFFFFTSNFKFVFATQLLA